MSTPVLITLVICGVVFIGFLVYYFNGKQVIIRTLASIPEKPASSLKTNELSKVTGKALHVKEPLKAPFTQRECVFYQMTIEQKVSQGKNTYWKTLVAEEKFQDFFIESRGDYVIVSPTESPKNYITHLVKDAKQSSGTFNDPTPKFERLLRRYNIDSATYFGFNKSLRYREGIIEVGELVTVAGIAKWKSISEPIPEYPYSKIAALESDEKNKLIITDLPEVAPERMRM